MIIPLTEEKVWLPFLTSLTAWQPRPVKTLVLAPHPDDETLGAGGLIADLCEAGIEVTIVAVTNGENAYPDYPGLGSLRIQEQEAALKTLGLSSSHIVRLHLTDSDLQSQRKQLEEALTHLMTPETQVIAPWPGDFHPDHIAVGEAATRIAQQNGASLIYYFFWTWHQGTPETLQGLPLQQYPLSEESYQKKLAALSCYQSQLHCEFAEPILPENLLVPAKRTFEVFLLDVSSND